MKRLDIVQLASVLANIGVLAGIGFLAYEVRQNSDLLEVQVRATQLEARRSLGDMLFVQPEALALFLQDPSELSALEYEQVRLLGTQFLVTSEWNYFEGVRRGEDMDRIARRTRSVIDRDALNYGALIAWPSFRETAEPEFVRWFEERVLTDLSDREEE